MTRRLIVVGCAMLLCAGCVTTPTGPTVKVMPGPEKSFEQFQADDAVCRQWSLQQAGGNPQTASVQGTPGSERRSAPWRAIRERAQPSAPAGGFSAGPPSASTRASQPHSRLSAAMTELTSSACTRRATTRRASRRPDHHRDRADRRPAPSSSLARLTLGLSPGTAPDSGKGFGVLLRSPRLVPTRRDSLTVWAEGMVWLSLSAGQPRPVGSPRACARLRAACPAPDASPWPARRRERARTRSPE